MPFCAANVEMAEADGAGGWIALVQAAAPVVPGHLTTWPRVSKDWQQREYICMTGSSDSDHQAQHKNDLQIHSCMGAGIGCP